MLFKALSNLLLGYLLPVEVLVLGGVGTVLAYGTGAPSRACWDLRPAHGVNTQLMDNCPFRIEFIGRERHFSPGKPLTVVLTGEKYRGFLLQAQDEIGNPLGSFSNAPEGTQYLSCSHDKDSFTHASTHLKTDVQVKWTSPVDYKGHVLFKATVAKNKTVFWEDILADLEDDTKQQQVAMAGAGKVYHLGYSSIAAVFSISAAVSSLVFWWK